MRQGILFFQ